ncbi:MAG TPA: hypothetical protein PKB06_11245, partial [Actinotalea sp.]|nr:hypothetical protein [Actinotalea sp.]
LLGWVIDAVLARLGRRGAVAPAAVGPPAVADGAGLGAEREELGEDGAGLGADREGLGEDGVTAPEQPV